MSVFLWQCANCGADNSGLVGEERRCPYCAVGIDLATLAADPPAEQPSMERGYVDEDGVPCLPPRATISRGSDRRDNPLINVCVYATAGERIDVSVTNVALNPIAIRIGGEYSTNKVGVYMGADEAVRLYALLGAALQEIGR